ncbi:SRPBCC family protein [Aestuariibacter sp. AA17]|uniref:SRPBCC family protein n=1 Tax=Fluctibacter corallii TaxID=2984329 RepID=A0ABT3AC76_9ALTE|nr:SRPBCC family protein [Aestuariibacter sp. AA17]MCV2886281.1 SRPBCC family protein [Aestuariibacter sp. AA17]
MNMVNLVINFHQPADWLFAQLADHQRFGEIIGANIKRVKDAPQTDSTKTDGLYNINGSGSVRRIYNVTGNFEEVITQFEPCCFIQYRVSKGSPIKNHLGEMRITATQSGCTLDYQIRFEPKLPVPGWGKLLEVIIAAPLRRGLTDLAKKSRRA